ncbi:hypothetical protein HC256_001391 [Beauveria bassiana]|nr:hypothetical protein HC256_001391 [Beauveria bassiana]
MARSGFQAVSRRICAEKSLKHAGTAEVQLSILDFPNSTNSNSNNVKRLIRLFKNQRGYSPAERQNRIPAVIDEADLHRALNASGLSRESLLSCSSKPPRLEFPSGFRMQCLRGRDRVQASEEVSRSLDPHWVVDLYIADISDEARRDLMEEYSSEKKPADGVFFRKIREYQGIFGEPNEYLEQKWWARLGAITDSEHRKSQLEKLFGHREFAPAFDAFRHLPALYCGLRLSVINKMIAMRCHEELLAYLRFIKDFWYNVFDRDEAAMGKLDEDTIDKIQLTAPGACERQARHLYEKVNSGQIFSAFSDTERNRIWLRLCSATKDCLVPSLLAFFENLKYLQPAADCMRRLVHLERKQSIRCAFEIAFSPGDGDACFMQTSLASFTTIPIIAADSFDIAYRQLWLYALREQREMPIKRKEKLATAKAQQADEVVVSRFARLAQRLGFKSDEIKALVEMDPDREIARRLLITARKPEEFEFDDINASIDTVTDVLATAQPISRQSLTDEDDIDCIERPPALCGKPHAADHAHDKKQMFLHRLHRPMPRPRLRLTSIFIQRSTFFAFFGKDLGISIDDLASAEDMHMLDQSSRHEQRLPVAERRPRRLEGQEVRLERLAATEQQLSANIEQLRNDMALQETRLLTLRGEEQEALQRLNRLQQTEAEHTLRVESLQADEQNRQNEIVAQEQRRANLGDQIRLDLLGPGEKEHLATVERDGEFPDHHTSSRPEQVSLVEDLTAEEKRLQAVVEHLTVQIARLDEEKASKEGSIAEVEGQHKLTVNQLVAEEAELRHQIDQLKRDLARLQARLDAGAGRPTELQQEQALEEGLSSPPIASSNDLPGTAANKHFAATEAPGDLDGQEVQGVGLEQAVREVLGSHYEASDTASSGQGQSASSPLVSQDEIPAHEEVAEAECTSQVSSPGAEMVRIEFKLLVDGKWRTQQSVVVDPAEPSAVQRLAGKYMRNGMGLFDSENQMLRPQNCFGRVTSDGTRTIHLIPEWNAIKEREAAWRPRKRSRIH